MKSLTTKMVIAICVIALLSGVATATVTSVWSNILTVNVKAIPWQGTITLSSNSVPYVGDQVILVATLSNPTPTTQQTVTFYFSQMSGVSASSPITGDPTTGWALIGGSQQAASVVTVNGVAQISCTVGQAGNYYFRAEVANPV